MPCNRQNLHGQTDRPHRLIGPIFLMVILSHKVASIMLLNEDYTAKNKMFCEIISLLDIPMSSKSDVIR